MASALRESRVAPSTFASLLRRSKFASFDPKVAQVYTTYDGHAHRGNWGLKRPLALRKKNGAFIVVKSVDSKEQQTEWYRAEQEARWLKAASELGKDIDLREESGSWFETMGEQWRKTYDSDYNWDPQSHSKFGPNITSGSRETEWDSTDYNRLTHAQLQNPAAMSPKELKRYLNGLHKSRRRFKALVNSDIEVQAQKAATSMGKWTTTDLFNVANKRPELLPNFLQQESRKVFIKPSSRLMAPSPHHNAGLSYSHTSDLTNKFLHAPVPGRILSGTGHRLNTSTAPRYDRPGAQVPWPTMTAGVAGLLGKVTIEDAGNRTPTKLADQEGHTNQVFFRTKAAVLWHAPQVVNPPELDNTGFKRTIVHLEFVNDKVIKSKMSNASRPGSQAYVAHEDTQATSSGLVSPAMVARLQKRKPARLRFTPGGDTGGDKYQKAIEDMLASVAKPGSYDI